MKSFTAEQRERLHELADRLTDFARQLSRLSPRTGLPKPSDLSDVLTGLTALQWRTLGRAGDINWTAKLSPQESRVYQRTVLSDAYVGPIIGQAVLTACAVFLASVRTIAESAKGRVPNESVHAYLDLLDAQNILINAAGALRELATQLTCESPAALDDLAAALATSSCLRERAAPTGR